MLPIAQQRILVTGGHGFLGQHLVARLKQLHVTKLTVPTMHDGNLMRWEDCQKIAANQDIIIHAAGKVGGIGANRAQPGTFFYENTLMGIQILEAARQAGVKKFVQIGSVCSYPKVLPHLPFREADLWAGYPEETNAAYGLAKKALLVQGQAYRAEYGMNVIHLLQVNLYGPGDHFGSLDSHVIPALIDRFWQAKQTQQPMVTVWGSGTPTREFLYVEDAAEGIVLATQHYNKAEPINLGSGREISIKNLAELIAELIGYKGQIVWDTTKPDGQPRRLFDASRAHQEFGFLAKTSFIEGLQKTITWYRTHVATKTREKARV